MSSSASKVRFLRYVKEFVKEPFPMFRLEKGTSFTGEEILKMGLPLPLFPDYEKHRYRHLIMSQPIDDDLEEKKKWSELDEFLYPYSGMMTKDY